MAKELKTESDPGIKPPKPRVRRKKNRSSTRMKAKNDVMQRKIKEERKMQSKSMEII